MIMRQRARGGAVLLAAAVAALLAPRPAMSQDYDMSAGWGGGYIKYAPFVDQGTASPRDIGVGGTWVAVLQAETWHLQRWVGLRVGGFYSRGSITYPTNSKNVGVYGGELAALVRVIPPAAGRSASAYVIGGGGLMWFQLGDGPKVPIAGTQTVIYSPDDQRQWMLLGGGGIEVMTGIRALDGQIGVRLEGVDQIAVGRPFRIDGGPDPAMMHNIRVSVALFSGVPGLF